MTLESFAIDVLQLGSEVALALKGAIDLDAAIRLKTVAEEISTCPQDVAIDWQAMTHLSAGGLQVLTALSLALEGAGRRLSVKADNAAARRMLILAGLSPRFPVPGAAL
jgi:anti-anti-sigma regulatory factor